MKKLIPLFLIALLFSCQNSAQVNKEQNAVINAKPVEVPMKNGKAKAYFASGCFWCVEAVYESVKGVDEVIDILSPEAFYKEAHQYIFEAIFPAFAPIIAIYFKLDKFTRLFEYFIFQENKIGLFLCSFV